MTQRKKTKTIYVGKVAVGGDAPITVQSMTTTPTTDVNATVSQVKKLEVAGCDIIRISVPDLESARSLPLIKSQINIPIIADIHFDYRMALETLKVGGAEALRINPGNIGNDDIVEKIVSGAKECGISMRIGVNGGSLEKRLLKKYGRATPEALVESALDKVEFMEKIGFENFKLSLKSSDVLSTLRAYRLFSEKCDYPLHIGVTEAGTLFSGTVKSAIGVGGLLADGIGDTLRISLTSDPVEEIRVGIEILKSLGLKRDRPEIISCPTCSRAQVDLIPLVNNIEKRIASLKIPMKIALMGCAVNGPGEAREADIGIAAGNAEGLLFLKGEVVQKIPENQLEEVILQQIYKLAEEKKDQVKNS